MAVVVFDSDVLIGFLNAGDAHHADAVSARAGIAHSRHPANAERGQLQRDPDRPDQGQQGRARPR